MKHPALVTVAMIGLCMQAVFGAVSPVAAICITFGHETAVQLEGDAASACDSRGCCAVAVNPAPDEERARIALSPPCDDACECCVDVLLPDDPASYTPRVDVPADAIGFHSPALIEAHQPRLLSSTDILPRGTGPPHGCRSPGAQFVRTIRLLI